MRVLVTGGAGFIGSNFVTRTLMTRPEYKITVLDSLTYAGRLENLAEAQQFAKRFDFVEGDIRDQALVTSLVKNSDAVVHFAAESHNDNSLKNPKIFFDTNVNGTINLVQAAAEHGTRFHHISTDEVFGDLPLQGREKFHTQTPYAPSSPYSASKASSDHVVRSWHRSFGLKATISNCSNNYGPRQHEEKFIPRSILLISSGHRPKIYGEGKNVRDWIHVDDHTDGVLLALEKGRIGSTYLLGADSERSNIQVVEAILAILGKPLNDFDLVADRQGHDLRYAIDASKTTKELGWTPVHRNFEKGLESVVDHYLEFRNNYNSLVHSDHSFKA